MEKHPHRNKPQAKLLCSELLLCGYICMMSRLGNMVRGLMCGQLKSVSDVNLNFSILHFWINKVKKNSNKNGKFHFT